MEADILTPEEQKALALQGATEKARHVQERYGIDLAKVARDPAEAVALVRAFAADKMLDPSNPPAIQGSFCNLLLNASGQKARETAADRERRVGLGSSVKRALFGGESRETGS